MSPRRPVAKNSRLRHLREAQHLSQEKLAEQLGTTALTIYRWEMGAFSPQPVLSPTTLHFFCRVLERLRL